MEVAAQIPVLHAILESYAGRRGGATAGAVLGRRGLVIDGRSDGSASVWDTDGARRLGRRFRWTTAQQSCFSNPCTVVDPRGAVMAASLGDGTVALVDLGSKRLISRLPAENGKSAEALAFTPDGRRLVTGGIAGTVTIWDVRSQAVVDRLRFSEPVAALAVSPDGRLVAVQRQRDRSREAHVEVRELASGTTVHTHRLGSGVGDLAFTNDGRVLVGCRRRGSTVVGWDTRSGARLFGVSAREAALTFALSADSRLMAVGTDDGRVMLRDAHSGRQQGPSIKVADGAIVQVAFSPDGRLLATGAVGGSATIWDVRSRTRVGAEFPVVKGVIPAVAFEPSGRLLITELVSAIEWPLDRPTLQRFACRVAGRNLTREEWNDLLPDRPYRPVCSTPNARTRDDTDG